MQFVLMKEQQEAERKRIEAQGIADFQHIVSQGISEQLLRWKGIEATMKIARVRERQGRRRRLRQGRPAAHPRRAVAALGPPQRA